MHRVARALPGVLTAVAFALPWIPGTGLLAGQHFSGYEIVGYAGHLQRLELSPVEEAALLVARLGVLAVTVAAAWIVLLGMAGFRTGLYRWCGMLLAVAAVIVIAAGVWLDVGPPQPGAILLAAAAVLFVVLDQRWQFDRLANRVRAGLLSRPLVAGRS